MYYAICNHPLFDTHPVSTSDSCPTLRIVETFVGDKVADRKKEAVRLQLKWRYEQTKLHTNHLVRTFSLTSNKIPSVTELQNNDLVKQWQLSSHSIKLIRSEIKKEINKQEQQQQPQ